jgi:microcompartment protein CcmK/EutM
MIDIRAMDQCEASSVGSVGSGCGEWVLAGSGCRWASDACRRVVGAEVDAWSAELVDAYVRVENMRVGVGGGGEWWDEAHGAC